MPRTAGATNNRILAAALVGASLASQGGCLMMNARPPTPEEPATSGTSVGSLSATMSGQLGAEELDGLIKAYADRYAALISTAFDTVKQDNPDQKQRAAADMFKAVSTTAIYDIATEQDSFTKFIDCLLVVTLQSKLWIDEDRAERFFGPERCEPVIRAWRQAREEIWELGGRLMTQQQLQQLDWLIWDWRRNNRDVEIVSFVRFADVGAARGRALLSEVKSSGGFLAPLDNAVEQARQVRLLGERAFYLGKRAPILMNWHSQALAGAVMSTPEVAHAVDSITKLNTALDDLSRVVGAIPPLVGEQREAIMKDIADRQAALDQTLGAYRLAADSTTKALESATALTGQGRELLTGLDKTSESLRGLLTSVDSIVGKLAPLTAPGGGPGNAPLELTGVRALVTDLSVTVKDLNSLVVASGNLLENQTWNTRIAEIGNLTDRRLDRAATVGREIIDYAFWRILLLIVAAGAVMVVYRIAVTAATRKQGATK